MRQVTVEKSNKSLLRNHLPGILTMSRKEVDVLIENFPSEATEVAKVLLKISMGSSREWSEHALAKVPLEKCVIENDELLSFDEGLSGSFRFLMKKKISDDGVQDFLKELDVRLELFHHLTAALKEHCASAHRTLYVDMLAWDENASGKFEDRGLNADVKFGHSIERMEEYLERVAKFIDYYVRDGALLLGIDLPFNADVGGYRRALEEIDGYFSKGYFFGRQALGGQVGPNGEILFCDENFLTDCDSLITKWDSLSDCRDSLLVRVIANLAANRAVLEHNFFIGLQRNASLAMASFLGKVNSLHLKKVPFDFFEKWSGVYSVDDNLFRWLRICFGQDGVVASSLGFGNRFMPDGALDLVVKWSLYLQEQYVKNRGNNSNLEFSRRQHGSLGNRVIFALVMVAAFFEKVKVPREFLGQRNSTYSVFPAPGELPSKPEPHAEEFLHISYGQVFYGNSDWNLHPDGIVNYASQTIKKRIALQQLAFMTVKRLTAPQILKNYIAMEHLNDSNHSWLNFRYGQGV